MLVIKVKERDHKELKTYLVKGGAGFIGSNYIHYMFKKYCDTIRIINVDALTYAGNLENFSDLESNENYTFIKANICDRDAINKIFEENDIDRVVQFSAESHVDRSIVNPEIFVETNVLGTATMLNAAKRHGSFLMEASRKVRSFFMYLLMKYTVYFLKMADTSMRQHLMHLIYFCIDTFFLKIKPLYYNNFRYGFK